MDEWVSNIATDFPILAVLLVVLIGQQRLAGRILDLIAAHMAKLIDAQEKIADEIQRKSVRSRDNSPRNPTNSNPL